MKWWSRSTRLGVMLGPAVACVVLSALLLVNVSLDLLAGHMDWFSFGCQLFVVTALARELVIEHRAAKRSHSD